MAGRYMRVKYETLCGEAPRTVREIVDFLGVDGAVPMDEFAFEVSPPESIGRWRAMADKTTIDAMHAAAGYALCEFGYV